MRTVKLNKESEDGRQRKIAWNMIFKEFYFSKYAIVQEIHPFQDPFHSRSMQAVEEFRVRFLYFEIKKLPLPGDQLLFVLQKWFWNFNTKNSAFNVYKNKE